VDRDGGDRWVFWEVQKLHKITNIQLCELVKCHISI
jgi:hypothetical protein